VLYELRVYHTAPGKLPALLARFRNVTLRTWEQYGIEQVGFWTTYLGESNSDLTYLLAWPDLGTRQQRWDAFQADQAWQAAKAESERDGALTTHITSTILAPTDFSALQ
jgi:NIPSNAP